jgi:hypothetical protein
MAMDDQPELSQTVAEAVNHLADLHGFPPEQQLSSSVTAAQVSIPCQRTWYGVQTLNEKTNGADFSACVAHVTQSDGIYPWFFLLCRLPGQPGWRPLASQGGVRRDMVKQVPGKDQPPRTCFCVGGLAVVPNGGSIRIELPNGQVYEDQAHGGCCIAFAPLTSEADVGRTVLVRYLDPDGNELKSETL